MFKPPPNEFIADRSNAVILVIHSCDCVYLWYAGNVATFKADRFASFYVLCNKK